MRRHCVRRAPAGHAGEHFGSRVVADVTCAAHPIAYVPLRGSKGTGFDQVFTNMDYNGGPVMPSNTDYMVLWSPAGLSAYPAGYVSGLGPCSRTWPTTAAAIRTSTRCRPSTTT